MKNFKCRRLLLCLIAFLLLLPTAILITRAIAVGNFPREGEAQLVRITAPDGAMTTLTPQDPLYSVVHDLLTLTDRVSNSALPSKRETYHLEFVEDGVTERLKLYIAVDKDAAGGEYLACFLLSSEERLYRLRLPNARIHTRILTPSRVDWLSSLQEEPLYTYGKDSYSQINLSDWNTLSSISLDAGEISRRYRLFNSENESIAEISDAAEIAAYSPSRVMCTVRWDVLPGFALESTYVFGVGDQSENNG